MITLTANTWRASATSDDAITTGSVGIPVRLVLSPKFDGLVVWVCFRCGGASRDVVASGRTVPVPAEVLQAPNETLRVGVYAAREDGTRVIKTVWASAGTVRQGVEPSGFAPSEPEPSWAARLERVVAEASEAVDGIVARMGSVVTPLLGTPLHVEGAEVDVVGVPAYVGDVSQYEAWGLTDPGWYAFARLTPGDGVVVTQGTTVDGAAGVIAELGADHVDVAVRFDVAAMARLVAVDWGGGRSEAKLFRATDLAVRNLDYRTTFYIYDLSPFVTWEWAPATDPAFVEGKDYWRAVGDGYEIVPVTEYTAGDPMPAWYEQAVSYQLTEDATFVEGKHYFVPSGDAYVEAVVVAGDPVAEGAYYEQAVSYQLTEDATYQDGKAYYRKSDASYAEATVVPGATVPEVIYAHSKMTVGSGLTRNVTYRLDAPVDCPSEFILPEVEDEEHGCWYEMRFRHTGSYSSTLTPPSSDVKVATQHTQAETEGINMVDLHYSAVAGAKVWRFMNTHSTFTADKPALESVAFRSAPATTEYAVGAALDTTGAEVVATYADGHRKLVTPTYSPANGAALTAEDTTLTASYTEGEVTATATAPLTITGGE